MTTVINKLLHIFVTNSATNTYTKKYLIMDTQALIHQYVIALDHVI